MLFLPRLRRRPSGKGGGGRKRAGARKGGATRVNPYAHSDNENQQFVTATGELESQRAEFATKKGVPVSEVRYISRTKKFCVHNANATTTTTTNMPKSSTCETTAIELTSPSSSAVPTVAPSTACEVKMGLCAATIGEKGDGGGVFGGVGSSVAATARVQIIGICGMVLPECGKGGERRMPPASPRKTKIRDEARLLVTTAAAVILVKAVVASRALGSSPALASVVAVVGGTWTRGHSSFQWVFSALASQLLVALKLKPHVSQLRDSVRSPRAAAPTVADAKSADEVPSPTESVPAEVFSVESREDTRLNSNEIVSNEIVAFQIYSNTSIPVRGGGKKTAAMATELASISEGPPVNSEQKEEDEEPEEGTGESSPGEEEEEIRAVPAMSPLVESNRLPATAIGNNSPCQKLKSRLFKSSPARKGENSADGRSFNVRTIQREESFSAVGSPLSGRRFDGEEQTRRKSSSPFSFRRIEREESGTGRRSGSPFGLRRMMDREDSGSDVVGSERRRSFSFSLRKTAASASASVVGVQTEGSTASIEPPSASPSVSSKATKGSKSHELPFFRSSTFGAKKRSDEAVATAVSEGSSPENIPETETTSGRRKSLSRSQEIKSVLKSLGRKKSWRSHELSSASAPTNIQELTIPTATAESLKALAFPFNEQPKEQRSSSSLCPARTIRGFCVSSKAASSSSSTDSTDDTASSRAVDAAVVSSSPTRISSNGQSKYSTSKFHRAASSADLSRPAVRNSSRMAVGSSSSSSPSERQNAHHLRKVRSSVGRSSEQKKNDVPGREFLGSFLVLTILGLLLVGRVQAILGTTFFCLVLSNARRFFSRNVIRRDTELLKRAARGGSRLENGGNGNWQGVGVVGSPAHDLSDRQSSEYRKRVLIGGFLDRGNRRIS